jgi:hypothetical protein
MSTVEVVEPPAMTAEQARALTDEIKLDAEVLWDKIATAYTRRAWAALSYESWDVYCIEEFGSTRLRLPREERTEVVHSLRHAGLSIRAIESATGASHTTVQKDLAEVYQSGTPDGSEVVDTEIVDAVVTHCDGTTTVIGRDGKSYPAQPKPKPDVPKPEPKRQSVPKDYSFEVDLLEIAIDGFVDIVELIMHDERYPKARKGIAQTELPRLERCVLRLEEIKDELRQ